MRANRSPTTPQPNQQVRSTAVSWQYLCVPTRHLPRGSWIGIPAAVSQSDHEPVRSSRPQAGRGTSYARRRLDMRMSASAPKETLRRRFSRRFFMARSPAAPGTRAGRDRGLRWVTLAVAAVYWLPIPPVAYGAEPPGSAAERGKQPSTDSGPSGNLSEQLKRSEGDRKSTRLNSSHEWISYAVF